MSNFRPKDVESDNSVSPHLRKLLSQDLKDEGGKKKLVLIS